MLQIGGIVVLFACVFGGYLMTGGSLAVIFEALPHELLTIFGAAIAAMLIAGSIYNLKKIMGSLSMVISGPRWKPISKSRRKARSSSAIPGSPRIISPWVSFATPSG
jgi:flagellar motor component MotA